MLQYQYLLIIYLFTIPIIIFLGYRKKQRIGFLFYLSCFLYVLLLCTRPGSIGSDTENYVTSFESSTYILSESYELTWIGICYIVDNILHSNIHIVFLIYALVTILPIIYVCHKDSNYPYFSLFLFLVLFGLMPFNIMRHSAALSLCLLAIHFLSKKKVLKAMLAGIFSIMFHNSAVIFVVFILIIYLFKKLSFSEKMLLSILWVTLFVGFVSFSIITSIISIFPTDKFSAYSEYALERGVNVYNIFIMNIINLCWGSVFLKLQFNFTKDVYYWAYYTSFLIGNFLSYQIGANRVLFFISITSIIYIPNLMKNSISFKALRLVTYYSIFTYLLFVRSVLLNGDGINP